MAAGSVHGALSASRASAGIAFDDRSAGRLVITTPAYRLALSKRNGKILSLVDRASGVLLARNANRCLWGVATRSDRSYLGGCSFAPHVARRFSYSWDRAAARLTLTYRGSAVVTVHALRIAFDLLGPPVWWWTPTESLQWGCK